MQDEKSRSVRGLSKRRTVRRKGDYEKLRAMRGWCKRRESERVRGWCSIT